MYNHVIFFYYKFEVSLLGQQKIKESSFSFFLVLNPWLNLSPKKFLKISGCIIGEIAQGLSVFCPNQCSLLHTSLAILEKTKYL